MYAIVKTGGKQYKVAEGDTIAIEHVEAEPGEEIELRAICVVDGDTVVADPETASQTRVCASVVEQFKGEKQLVFKFKKRKNYKSLRGHRQKLTRVRIDSIGQRVEQNGESADSVEDDTEVSRASLDVSDATKDDFVAVNEA